MSKAVELVFSACDQLLMACRSWILAPEDASLLQVERYWVGFQDQAPTAESVIQTQARWFQPPASV